MWFLHPKSNHCAMSDLNIQRGASLATSLNTTHHHRRLHVKCLVFAPIPVVQFIAKHFSSVKYRIPEDGRLLVKRNFCVRRVCSVSCAREAHVVSSLAQREGLRNLNQIEVRYLTSNVISSSIQETAAPCLKEVCCHIRSGTTQLLS